MKMIKQTLGLNVEDSKYYIKLIIEAVLIGLFSGFVVSLYRFGLDNSENILFSTLKYIQGDFLLTLAWFCTLALMGLITALLMKWDPDSLGSGIPIVMGEVKGYFDVCWWKTLVAKFIGGTLTALGGLSLGREGPSVQLGAMAAKGVSKYLPNSKTDEKRLLVCGSGAGLSATFSAPLAGFIFTLEEINKGFDRSIVGLSSCSRPGIQIILWPKPDISIYLIKSAIGIFLVTDCFRNSNRNLRIHVQCWNDKGI